jgi:glycosyltransferase involved in cell wall biosynthesis
MIGSSNSLHIAFIVTRGDAVGGATVHVRDMARYLLDRGERATVLVGETQGNQDALREFRRFDIPCRLIPSLHRAINPAYDIAAVHALSRALGEIKPDLVSTHTAKAGLLGRIAARNAGIPAIYTPHGWAISDRISKTSGRVFRIAERLAAPLARKIVNVCEAEKRLAQTHRIADAEKLVVIHNGVRDIPSALRASPSGSHYAAPRLIMVARFEAPKDHQLLLHALASLCSFDWQLELAGSGPLEPDTRALARRLGLAARVHFSGHTINAAENLSRAQIFVLASNSEGLPRSILEAMRAGLPVVASDVGGVSEAVIHRETGFVAPRGNAEALTKALALLIVSPALRAQFGAAGRERYERRFTFDQMVRKTVDLYRQVLNRTAAPLVASAGRF